MSKVSHTKITATLGPACSSKEVLGKMFQEGVDMCRLNFSHSNYDEHLRLIRMIRELNDELGTHVAILADLQGPKLRIGEVENNLVTLAEGDVLKLVGENIIGTRERVYMSYQPLPKEVKTGDSILVDDGKIKLEVIETNHKDCVTTRVIHGGPLSSHKGVNLPDTRISLPSLTEKDRADARWALEQDVDWIALSFVRHATDIIDLKDLIKKSRKNARVIAKIEKPEALDEIDNIIDISDAVMIARGDLGVEVSFDRVPLIQKNIIRKCIDQAKPVIIATQMLESMMTNFRPNRAEANDVANAVLDGADSLMLSGETSIGQYPVEVIRTMQSIILWTEQNGAHYIREHAPAGLSTSFLPDSICYNAVKMAEQTGATAIIAFTASGYTALRISSHRPKANIFAFTPASKLLHTLSPVWGIQVFPIDTYEKIDDAISYTLKFLLEKKLIREEEVVVHVGSTPLIKRGQTNLLKLSYV